MWSSGIAGSKARGIGRAQTGNHAKGRSRAAPFTSCPRGKARSPGGPTVPPATRREACRTATASTRRSPVPAPDVRTPCASISGRSIHALLASDHCDSASRDRRKEGAPTAVRLATNSSCAATASFESPDPSAPPARNSSSRSAIPPASSVRPGVSSRERRRSTSLRPRNSSGDTMVPPSAGGQSGRQGADLDSRHGDLPSSFLRRDGVRAHTRRALHRPGRAPKWSSQGHFAVGQACTASGK